MNKSIKYNLVTYNDRKVEYGLTIGVIMFVIAVLVMKSILDKNSR